MGLLRGGGFQGTVVSRWPGPMLDEGWRGRGRVPPDRLAAAWGMFIGRIPWELFVTLTFDPIKKFPVSREAASRETFRWLGMVGYALALPVSWAYATERHRNGQWHAHVLLVGLRGRSLQPAASIWDARNGGIDVQNIWGPARLVVYASKQAALDGEVVISDTLVRYRDVMRSEQSVLLHPPNLEPRLG